MSRARQKTPAGALRPAARIAAERARKGRGERRAKSSTGRPKRAPARAAPASRQGGPRRPLRRRLWLIFLGMALLGFATVYVVDGIERAFEAGRLADYSSAELWQKLKDRLLDRDVPRARERPSVKPPPAKAPGKATGKALVKAPKAAPLDPPEPRADMEAAAPEAYARESRGLTEAQQARQEALSRRARVDAILQKVGIPVAP